MTLHNISHREKACEVAEWKAFFKAFLSRQGRICLSTRNWRDPTLSAGRLHL